MCPHRSSRRWRRLVALAAVAGGLLACGQQADHQPVSAGAPAGPTTVAPAAPATVASPVSGVSPADLKALVDAPPSARALTTGSITAERVTVPATGRVVVRIRIAGHQPVRALPATLLLDGKAAGPALVTTHLDALVAVVSDTTVAHEGATVGYRYGAGPTTTVGTLRIGR